MSKKHHHAYAPRLDGKWRCTCGKKMPPVKEPPGEMRTIFFGRVRLT